MVELTATELYLVVKICIVSSSAENAAEVETCFSLFSLFVGLLFDIFQQSLLVKTRQLHMAHTMYRT